MSHLEPLDHLVFAGPDLQAAIDHVERLTGVRAEPSGRHPIGTANALIAFTVDGRRAPHYLEVIGPDEGRVASDIPKFGIDRLTGPELVTYAIHPDDLDTTLAEATAAGLDLGQASPLSRRKPDGTLLEWRISLAEVDTGAVIPFLIDWGSTEQPGLSDLPTLELLSVALETPEPDATAAHLAVLGVPFAVTEGPRQAVVATVRTLSGDVVELR